MLRLACPALLLLPLLLAGSVTAAAADPPVEADAKPAAKGKKADDAMASLRVELLATKPGDEQPPGPVKNAMVKFVGKDDWYETDDSGRTQRMTGEVGSTALLVRPPGSNPCSVAVALKKGDQDLTILVQTAPELTCRVKPAP
jgi:hypothetical protein